MNCDNIPPGYEAVSLIEALNGPCIPRQPPSAMPDLVETPDNESAVQAAQILNHHSGKNSKNKDMDKEAPPDFGMSVLIGSRDEELKETPKCPLLSSDNGSPRNKHSRPRDTMRLVNEKAEKEEVRPILIMGYFYNTIVESQILILDFYFCYCNRL